jgi:YVTN family beta-propeller protein
MRVRHVLASLFILAGSGVAHATGSAPIRWVQTIALPGVEGRIDHMALDPAGQRLFVAALGNNTVEVIDLETARRTRSLTGFREPQGVGFASAPPRLFVSNGGDGSVSVLDGDSLRLTRIVQLGEDADNVRVDEAGHHVCIGYGGGGLATLDAASGELLGCAPLPAHPEAFQLESPGTRVFVNVPDSAEVCVIDREKGEVAARWGLGGARANFPLALDSASHRVFVGCRRPAMLLVLGDTTGQKLAGASIDGDVDDMYFDSSTQRLIASCGAGFVDIVQAPAIGALRMMSRVPTGAGARTSLYDPPSRRLYVAVPHRGTQAAEIRIFEVARP